MVVAHALGVLGNKVVCRVKRMGKYMFIYYTVLYQNQVEPVTRVMQQIFEEKSNVLIPVGDFTVIGYRGTEQIHNEFGKFT